MISQDKAAARKAAAAARKTAHAAGLDEAANRALVDALSGIAPDAVVSGYMPIRTEVSPLPAMTILYGLERRICVPVIVGQGQPLEFHEWTPDADMVEGPYGAQVPKGGAVLRPDVLITPLLAFDRDRYRLGYGGGFYDRTFATLSAQGPMLSVGFAYAAQEVPQVPREETDWQLDMVVTEAGVIRA